MIKQNCLNEEIDSKFINFGKVAKLISETMCVTQRQNGKYELLNINDAHKIYKDEIETLYKSKYQSKVTKYSPFEAAGQENIINNELNKI